MILRTGVGPFIDSGIQLVKKNVNAYGSFGEGPIPCTWLTLGCNLYSGMSLKLLQNSMNFRSNLFNIYTETGHGHNT